jgi:serine/threonine protein kinase
MDSHDRVKITDFGLSEEITSNSKIAFAGSVMFVVPEIWKRMSGSDPFLADIYSLGVTFYFISQEKAPFANRNIRKLKKCSRKFFSSS